LPVKKDQGDIRENSHLIHARVKIESSKYGYKKQLIENTPKIITEKIAGFVSLHVCLDNSAQMT